MQPKLMLIGLGDLGSVILELLAREAGLGQIVVASRNLERGIARCNLARLGALAQGCQPDIRFVPLDLNHKEAVAEIVAREQPALILSAATMQSWWLPHQLPPSQAEPLNRAGFGAWLPVHLTLTLKLMEALRLADYTGPVLTAPFPDVVNHILGKLNLAPTCGIGNLDEIVPKIRLLAAQRLQVPPAAITVWLVAHHALEPFAFGEASGKIPPYYLRIEHAGRDITAEIKADALLLAPYPVTPGPPTHFLTAGSTIRLIRALFDNQETRLHAPAPNGLPGGYPVLAGRGQVQVANTPGLTRAEAVAINEQSHRFDGIERIEADGTAIFRPDSVQRLRHILGYDCPRLPPAEAEDRATELIARFREYAARQGVNFD